MNRGKRKVFLKLVLAVTAAFAMNCVISSAFAAPQPGTYEYTVKKGDTFYKLGQRFSTSADEIIAANPGIDPKNLLIGRKIQVTVGKGTGVRSVKKGDTLWKIAGEFGSSVDAIAKKNLIENPDLIYAGDLLAIPVSEAENDVSAVQEHVVELIKNRDFVGLSKVVHPVKGIRFSPYATVSLKQDLVFTPTQLSAFAVDNKKYIWGAYDGSGFQIEKTPSQYFDEFIDGKHFRNPDRISYDKVYGKGNSIENQFEIYPKATIVEYYNQGTEQYAHIDFSSLRMVFEQYDEKWYLVGIIRSVWTI